MNERDGLQVPLTGTVLAMDGQLAEAAGELLQTIAAINSARLCLRTANVDGAQAAGRRVIEHLRSANASLRAVAGMNPNSGGMVH